MVSVREAKELLGTGITNFQIKCVMYCCITPNFRMSLLQSLLCITRAHRSGLHGTREGSNPRGEQPTCQVKRWQAWEVSEGGDSAEAQGFTEILCGSHWTSHSLWPTRLEVFSSK